MRCFTITDKSDEEFVEAGIIVSDTAAILDFGKENDPVIVQNEHPAVKIGVGCAVSRVPVSAEHAEAFTTAKKAFSMNALKLLHADVVDNDGTPKIVKERAKSPWLLVHVALAAGVGGKLWFEDAIPEKEFDGWEVRTKPRPFPGPGVKVLAIGCGHQGEPQALLKVARGAGFRIRRSGQLEGVPPVIEVHYGRELTARPRYKKG